MSIARHQLELFGNAIQIAIDQTVQGLAASSANIEPNTDALILALAGKLGEAISKVRGDRNVRRIITKRAIEIIEIASRAGN